MKVSLSNMNATDKPIDALSPPSSPPLPKVIISCAMTLDGYLDDSSTQRLLLSNEEDFDRVDALRASCDAILVGANTIRQDNPRLLIRSDERREKRKQQGKPEDLLKITLTQSGRISPQAAFFTTGQQPKWVYCPTGTETHLKQHLGAQANILPLDTSSSVCKKILRDLAASPHAIQRLMVEGGGNMIRLFLTEQCADELHIAIAPFFVSQTQAPRCFPLGTYLQTAQNPMTLQSIHQLGDMAILVYHLNRGS